jgi:hypothetical protein
VIRKLDASSYKTSRKIDLEPIDIDQTLLQIEFLHKWQEPGGKLHLARSDKDFVTVGARSWREDGVMVFGGRRDPLPPTSHPAPSHVGRRMLHFTASL